MIRLFPGHALVVDDSGHSQTLDFDSLRDALAGCFAERGINETWLAEHVACIVEERVRERHRQTPGVLGRRDIDEMILAAVRSVGFADVAELYAATCGLSLALPKPSGELATWSDERLRSLLERSLQLPSSLVEATLPQLAATLTRLGLPKVNDALLRELALHLLATGCDAEAESAHEGAIRMFPDDHWLTRFRDEPSGLLTTGVLRIHPVSAALPRARVEFDVARFGARLGRPPLLEMQVLAALPRAARSLRAILAGVRADICTSRPSAAAHPAQVILRGSQALLASQLEPLCARDAHGFLADMRGYFEREVCLGTDFEIILSLR